MICDLAPAMILYPPLAQRQVYQEPYGEISLYPEMDYYTKREIESFLHRPSHDYYYPRAQNLRGEAHPVMLADVTRRLTTLYREKQARENELRARNRLLQLQNILSEIDATTYQRRRPFRYSNFEEYDVSESIPTCVPLLVKRCTNDHFPRKNYVKPTKRTSCREDNIKRLSKNDSLVETKFARGRKKSKELVEKKAKVETKDASKAEKSKLKPVVKPHKQNTDPEAPSIPEQKELKSAEKMKTDLLTDNSAPQDCSMVQLDVTETTKTALDSTQCQDTKKDAQSGHQSEPCSPKQSTPASQSESCSLSRCPSIEEVEDEEFKNLKSK